MTVLNHQIKNSFIMNQIPHDFIYTYLLSGRVFATFHNTLTNNQLSISIRKKSVGIWFVRHQKDYLGYIRGDMFIKNQPNDDRVISEPVKLITSQFNWVWKQIVAKTLPLTMDVMHDGTCGYCGRKLTDAISIKLGIGPTCMKKLNISSQTKLELQ